MSVITHSEDELNVSPPIRLFMIFKRGYQFWSLTMGPYDLYIITQLEPLLSLSKDINSTPKR